MQGRINQQGRKSGNGEVEQSSNVLNEPISQVLGRYDVSIIDMKNIVYKGKKGVWWITSRKGDMVLKKMPGSEGTVSFITACVRHLTQNGVKIPEILKTKDGQDFVVIDKICFVLSRAISGKKLDPDNIVDIRTMAAELGRFHRASIGFSCMPGQKQKNHLGSWILEYESFLEDMNIYYKAQRDKRTRTPAETLIVREFPYFYERGKSVIEGLHGEEYNEWVRLAHKQGSLCHQDFSTANLIAAADGIYVLDTDSVTIDIAARDLRKLFNKVIKRQGKWDPVLVNEILRAYESQLQLSVSQHKVVALDLMFPHLFLGAMDKYAYKRDKTWTEDNYYNRLNEMLLFEKSKGIQASSLGLNGHQKARG